MIEVKVLSSKMELGSTERGTEGLRVRGFCVCKDAVDSEQCIRGFSILAVFFLWRPEVFCIKDILAEVHETPF